MTLKKFHHYVGLGLSCGAAVAGLTAGFAKYYGIDELKGDIKQIKVVQIVQGESIARIEGKLTTIGSNKTHYETQSEDYVLSAQWSNILIRLQSHEYQ